jgi:uncharacterized protein YcbX
VVLKNIYIYPIKSLGAIALERCEVTPRGLKHDRRFMLVDEHGKFITQREAHGLHEFLCETFHDGFLVRKKESTLMLPWQFVEGESINVQVWDDAMEAIVAPDECNAFFSQELDRECKLVYMPDLSLRPLDPRYAEGVTSFSDGYPYLVIGTASLDELNRRMASPIGMDRFRPNFVVETEKPFEEDEWRKYHIGTIPFEHVKPCGRCVFTTIDQETGLRSAEPLKTLASFRNKDNKILFGQNTVVKSFGATVHCGDLITIESSQPPLF